MFNQQNLLDHPCIAKVKVVSWMIKADGINLLFVLALVGIIQQRQTWGRKVPNFGWATFGWVSCNIDTFVTFV